MSSNYSSSAAHTQLDQKTGELNPDFIPNKEIIDSIDIPKHQLVDLESLEKARIDFFTEFNELLSELQKLNFNSQAELSEENKALLSKIGKFIDKYFISHQNLELTVKNDAGHIPNEYLEHLLDWSNYAVFGNPKNKTDQIPNINAHEISKISQIMIYAISDLLTNDEHIIKTDNIKSIWEDLKAQYNLFKLINAFDNGLENELITTYFLNSFLSNSSRSMPFAVSQVELFERSMLRLSVTFPKTNSIINISLNLKGINLPSLNPPSILFIRTFIYNSFIASKRSLNKELEIKAYLDPTKQWVIVEDNIQPTGNIDPETIFNSQMTTIDRLANDLCELNKDDISDDALLKAVIEKLDKLLLITSEGATKMAIYYYVKMFITKQEFPDLTYEFLKLVKEKNLTQLTSFIKANIIDFISTNENGELKKQAKISAKLATFAN